MSFITKYWSIVYKSSQDSQKVLQSRCKLLLCVTCKLYVKDSIYKSTWKPPEYCTGMICYPSKSPPNSILLRRLWTNAKIWGNIFFNVHFTSEDWPKKSVSQHLNSKFIIGISGRPWKQHLCCLTVWWCCLVSLSSLYFHSKYKTLSLKSSKKSTNSAGPQSCANVKCIFKIFMK